MPRSVLFALGALALVFTGALGYLLIRSETLAPHEAPNPETVYPPSVVPAEGTSSRVDGLAPVPYDASKTEGVKPRLLFGHARFDDGEAAVKLSVRVEARSMAGPEVLDFASVMTDERGDFQATLRLRPQSLIISAAVTDETEPFSRTDAFVGSNDDVIAPLLLVIRRRAALSAASQEAKIAVLSGSVVTEGDRPVSEARIEVFSSDETASLIGAGESSDRGVFAIRDLPVGRARVRVSARGYSMTEQSVEIAAPESTLRFELGSEATIAGRVLDEHQKPIEGAWIEISSDTSAAWQVASRADGSFLAPGLSANAYYLLHAHRTGYLPDSRIAAAGGRNVHFILVAATALEGRVVNAVTGSPITKFRLAIVPCEPGRTSLRALAPPGREIVNTEGRFTTAPSTLRPRERYDVEFRAEDFATAVFPAQVAKADAPPIVAKLQPSAHVRGRILDAHTLLPIADARVISPDGALATGLSFGATSNRLGVFVAQDVPATPGRMIVRHAHYVDAWIEAPALATRAVEPYDLGDLHLRPSGSVRVRVFGGKGELRSGDTVVVGLAGANAMEAVIPESGELLLESVPTGAAQVSLRASDPSLDGRSADISVCQGQETPVVFGAAPSDCAIEGSASLSDSGVRHDGIEIRLIRFGAGGTENEVARMRSGTDGKFRFPRVAPGPYRIDASVDLSARRYAGSALLELLPGPTQLSVRLCPGH